MGNRRVFCRSVIRTKLCIKDSEVDCDHNNICHSNLAMFIFLVIAAVCFAASLEVCGPGGPEVFHYGDLCALDPAPNVVDLQLDLKNEVECQNHCVQDPLCNHWMFQKTTTGRTSCFLLQECNITETSCADTPDCQMTILGPEKPLLSNCFCIDFGFADMSCKMEDEIDRFSNVADQSECQHLCRAKSDCRVWTFHDDICRLCRNWGDQLGRPDCSYYSGPVFPDVSSCDVFSDEYEPCGH